MKKSFRYNKRKSFQILRSVVHKTKERYAVLGHKTSYRFKLVGLTRSRLEKRLLNSTVMGRVVLL